jgi:excisionase family DNA binding protein
MHVTAILYDNIDLGTVTRYNRPNNVRGENKPDMADNELLTVEDVAKEVKVHTETVRSWIRKKELAAINIGGEYRIYRRDLEDFLQRRKTIKPDTP